MEDKIWSVIIMPLYAIGVAVLLAFAIAMPIMIILYMMKVLFF